MTSTHQLPVNSVLVETPQEITKNLHRGLLTSMYKQHIQFATYGLKQRMKRNQHHLTLVAGTILKITVFVIAYIIAFV